MNTLIQNLTLDDARKGLLEKKFSARELAESSLSVIKEKDSEIHAFLEVFEDVLLQADRADTAIAAGERGALLGIPLAIKDNILIDGRKASAASKILEGYTASYDATVIGKLKNEGGIFIGRTNMDEFGMGSSTENSAFGPTKNPFDTLRVPGGSSGGSAAAISMGATLAALGTDTGGSVRQPASLCGLVGLKPTYGALSRFGVIALGTSLDQVGLLTKTVADSEILFSILRSHDPLDSTSLPDSFFKKHSITERLSIGIPRDLLGEGIDKEVRRIFEAAVLKFKSLGFTVKEVSLPNARYALSIYYIVLPAEISANLARYDGMRFGVRERGENLLQDYLKTRGLGFGREPRRRIILGTYVLSHGYYDAYYNKATALRELLRKDYENAFREVDILITPTAPTSAFKIGEKTNDPLTMYLEDIFTTPVSLAGIPALSIPGGMTSSNPSLPVGIQLIAPNTREDLLFHVGKLFEKA
jgi:aspartyl-tRNA(Asn)/glutamyl-tRNA(Gln) amidotransferase subunit A